MNKKLLFCLSFVSICLMGCSRLKGNSAINHSEEGTIVVTKSNGDSSTDSKSESSNDSSANSSLEIEKDTPQFWIDLFTFDNVTIELKYNTTFLKDKNYKCVGGDWYIKEKGEESFKTMEEDPSVIYGIYLSHYSAFEYREAESLYYGEGWAADDSGYLHRTSIVVDTNKVTYIADTSYLNSSSMMVEIYFSDYGTTTL